MLDELERKQAMFAAIIESSEDAIISKSLDSIIMSWNNAAERMFGYSEAEAVGKHIFLIIPPDLHAEEEMIIRNLKEGKKIEHYRTIRVRKSGELAPISLTISPIKDLSGKIIGASKIVRDITKEKRDEETIHQYALSLETINAVSKKISSKLDYHATLQLVTDVSTELTGAAFGAFFANKTDAKGDTYMLYTLSGIKPEEFEKYAMPANTEVFKSTFSGEAIIRSDDITKDARYGSNAPNYGMPKGNIPVVSYLAVPVISQSGIVIGGLFFGHPKEGKFKPEHEKIVLAIAAQAAVALDNSKLYEDIKLLNSKKDEFIGMASHELKTPLTTMSGYLQLIEAEPENTSLFLPKITKQVTRLHKMIGDLLDISKIQAGKLDFKFEKTSLHKIIKDSIDAMPVKEHTISIEIPADDITVTADAGKIVQVIVNLLSNAIKYSAINTSIVLSAAKLGDKLQVCVSDNGFGIPKEHLDKIFDQFYRISKNAGNIEGMGLGLFISKEIIDQHYGKIWAESEVGKGSSFFIEFPIGNFKI